MDKFELQSHLNEKFDEYKFFINGGSLFKSIVMLGEVYNCIPELDKAQQFEWLEKLREEKLSDTQIQSVVTALENDVNEIERLLSIFKVWLVEQLVLILTLRIQVDLVTAVLDGLWYKQFDVDLKNIDERISEVSMAKASKRAFKASAALIRDNWGMPIDNVWLNK